MTSLPPEPHDWSEASRVVARLRPLGRDGARRVLRAAFAKLPIVEQAALAARWRFWGRSKQLAPYGDGWKTCGFLAGRGFGKTLANANFVNDEVEAGRAMLVGLAAQDEANCIALQVNGPSGLIATAPPWFKPVLHGSTEGPVVHWPNGARAYVRTPEVPGKIRGLEYQLSWICEIQSWPKASQQEALDNFFLATRLGYARIVWDATAKRRHPLLKALIAAGAAEPRKHVVVRGALYENAANLGDGYVAEMERKFAGTQRGREELNGEMLDDADGALFQQGWIDSTRRQMPPQLLRRILSVDPAVTNRKGSDTTGINESGLGVDGQMLVLGDYSGKIDPGKWAEITLDRYVAGPCSLILAETNKGGQLIAQNLRAAAKERGLEVIVVEKDERPQPIAGKVFVKEVFARGAKEDRAEPVATAYERRRISHVFGVDLGSLEDTLTTWEPAPGVDSPGDLDALVHAAVELLDLSNNVPDPAAAFVGITEVAKQLAAPVSPTSITQALAGYGGRGDRI